MTYATLQTRFSLLNTRIDAGLSAGKLTADEARTMKAQLNQLNTAVRADNNDGNGLTFESTYNSKLDSFTAALTQKIGTVTVTPPPTPAQPNPADRINAMEQRIDRAVTSGLLTGAEAQDLRSKLAMERGMLAGAEIGGLTASEKTALNTRLDVVERALTQKLNNTQYSVADRMDGLRARIATGVEDGTITMGEKRALEAKLAEVQGLANGANLDGRISAEERQALDAKFDVVGQAVVTERNDNDIDVDLRMLALDKEIVRGERAGKIDPFEALQLRGELGRLQLKAMLEWFKPDFNEKMGLKLAALSQQIDAAKAN